jgi:diguanylate cyclase (GGDEF)-like protein
VPDEKIEGAVAVAELLRAQGQLAEAALRLEQTLPLPAEGASLRVRCLFFQTLADIHEHLGNAAQALLHLRSWQQLHVERTQRASTARQQAASLQTELLRLQRERDLIDARRRSTERDKAELEATNRQLAQKVDEVEALQAALERQAVRDFLTGLFNRRHLNDVLPSMLALASRDRQPLTVAIIDLDHFKDVNDRHGHLAGDMLLAAFAKLLSQRMRRSDIACRYGGEEFCLLLPRTAASAAQRKVAALLKLWRTASFKYEAVTLTGNTFSAGVADSVQVPESSHALLKAADDCVLEAKRLGRNRVVAYQPTAQEVG